MVSASFKPSFCKGLVAGGVGCALNGLFSVGGPPVVLYMSNTTNNNQEYFAGIQFYFCATNILSTLTRVLNGIIDLNILIYALLGFSGCILGDCIGRLLFNKLNGDKLKKIIYIGMIISAILMFIS